jgi:hypothetical protein
LVTHVSLQPLLTSLFRGVNGTGSSQKQGKQKENPWVRICGP